MTVAAKKIVPFPDQSGDYLKCRDLAKGRGMKLPSNVLHDDKLVLLANCSVGNIDYPAWAREFIVHPAKDGKFVKGEDVVDSKTGWRLPGEYLADPRFVNEDVFQKGIGLFIDPEDIDVKGSKPVVIPLSIIVLSPFIQLRKGFGKFDEVTRIPIDKEAIIYDGRYILRDECIGVRPIYRDLGMLRRTIVAHHPPSVVAWACGETIVSIER